MARDYCADWMEEPDLENYREAPIWSESNKGCAHKDTGRLEVRNVSFAVLQKNKIHPPSQLVHKLHDLDTTEQ